MSKISNFLARFKAKEMTEVLRDATLTAKDKEAKLNALYEELKAVTDKDKAEQTAEGQKDKGYVTKSDVSKALGNMNLEELKALADKLRKGE